MIRDLGWELNDDMFDLLQVAVSNLLFVSICFAVGNTGCLNCF